MRSPLPLFAGVAASLSISACSLMPMVSAPVQQPPTEQAATEPAKVAVVPLAAEPVMVPLAIPAIEAVPTPPPDLVSRLASEFELPIVDDADVASELAWYGSHPEYIDRVFGRASRYLHHIAEVLEQRDMPTDLALLPIVESAFDPFAYSHGRASGLWQIIPGTGEWLGLKQNWWYDGRRDIIDSTDAALDYLEQLHDQFDGDWLLAVAGYNSGAGNVSRAIRRAEAAGLGTDFWSIQQYLPQETARYVPKLLAIRDLVAMPEAFDITLPVIDNEPFFAAVETAGQIDIALAAELSGLSVDAVYELNPGINRWATDPDGPHRILVPVEHEARTRTALASIDPADQVRWSRHEIASGETLGEIAERYETTPGVLRDINDISGHMIRAGDFLMIPHASAGSSVYSMSLEARTQRTQDRDRGGRRIDYQVRPGDSLWSIATRHDISTGELASWNAMAPGDVLSVGKTLVIWSDDPLAAAVASVQGPAQVRRINYVVRRGDSLSTIAGRFRVSLGDLLGWNAISPDDYLQPGQAIVLYVDVTEQSS